MTTIRIATAFALIALASPAWAKVCLPVQDIVGTKSDDGKLLTFKLRNGQTLVNHLQGVCSDLIFNGFEWTIRGTETVCENEESLRVLHSGQVCVLGKFDPPTGGHAPG